MRVTLRQLFIAMAGACFMMGSLSIFAKVHNGYGRLTLNVNPHRAGVFVDGKYYGPALDQSWHLLYPVPEGEHEITLKDPRFHDFTTKVTIVEGKTTKLEAAMQPLPPYPGPYGTLRVEGGSSRINPVYLNGRFMGHIDEFNNSTQGLQTKPGVYTLRVDSLSGITEYNNEIRLEANKVTVVYVESAG